MTTEPCTQLLQNAIEINIMLCFDTHLLSAVLPRLTVWLLFTGFCMHDA
jgi:hypothetical protein